MAHLTSVHLRNIRTNQGGYCVKELRNFCATHEFSLKHFLTYGAEAVVLDDGKAVEITCDGKTVLLDDAQVLKLVLSICE